MASKLLNPVIIGPLWLALKAPRTREKAMEFLSRYLSSKTIDRLQTALGSLTAVGFALWASSWFSEVSQNNFRLRSERHRYDWPKEVAVITGGTGGFGSLMAKDLASHGINVVCVDIVEELPKHMQDNPKIHYYRCDITDSTAVKAMAERVRAEHGDPKILINNAGISGHSSILEASQEELEKLYKVNTISQYYTLQAFLPAMIADHKGHIVSIASLASFISGAGLHSYSGTKAALVALHEGLAQDLRVNHNAPEIKLTIVHPTFAETAIITAHRDEIVKSGSLILDPKVVSDAVVKQILSGRGKQLIIAPDNGFIRSFRGWPRWAQQLGFRVSDVRIRNGAV